MPFFSPFCNERQAFWPNRPHCITCMCILSRMGCKTEKSYMPFLLPISLTFSNPFVMKDNLVGLTPHYVPCIYILSRIECKKRKNLIRLSLHQYFCFFPWEASFGQSKTFLFILDLCWFLHNSNKTFPWPFDNLSITFHCLLKAKPSLNLLLTFPWPFLRMSVP